MMSIKKNVSDIPQRKALGILSLNSRSSHKRAEASIGYLMDVSDRRYKLIFQIRWRQQASKLLRSPLLEHLFNNTYRI